MSALTKYDMPDFSKASILVVGDIMLDEYIWGDVIRISPEAPVPVVKIADRTYTLGGAGNVAANLAGLGCTVNVIGVIGKDVFGQKIDRLLHEKAIHNNCAVMEVYPTTGKTRIMSKKQQLIRIDQEDPEKIPDERFDELKQVFQDNAFKANAVVFSDYAKRLLNSPFIESCIGYCHEQNLPAFVDPKTNDWGKYRGAFCVSPNEDEFMDVCRFLGVKKSASLSERAGNVRETFDLQNLLVTRGAEGMVLFQKGEDPLVIPAKVKEVFDVSGAGDTVISVLSAAYAAGRSMPYAVELANIAAEFVVGKVGTYPISFDELEDYLRTLNEGHLHKIFTLEQGFHIIQKWRARKETIVFTNGCFDLLHTGHIKILQAAAKEGNRLIVGLNTDESVRMLKGPTRPVLNEKDRASIISALGCVDMVVFFSEETPLKLIRHFKPDVIVKGQDYSKDTIIGADLVESWGGKVVLVPLEKGKSTSLIIENIKNGYVLS